MVQCAVRYTKFLSILGPIALIPRELSFTRTRTAGLRLVYYCEDYKSHFLSNFFKSSKFLTLGFHFWCFGSDPIAGGKHTSTGNCTRCRIFTNGWNAIRWWSGSFSVNRLGGTKHHLPGVVIKESRAAMAAGSEVKRAVIKVIKKK